MAPKQKEAKKGPTYKASTASKDIVPATVKEPPRQYKSLKVPQSFPQNLDKNEGKSAQFSQLFEEWPSEETVKGFDFGINSQTIFQDAQHELINQYIEQETKAEKGTVGWKKFPQIDAINAQQIEAMQNKQQQKKGQGEEEEEVKKKEMVVIQTFMREETEQQLQRRKKDEAEKAQKAAKEKKKGKKQQPKDEGPQQISDVKMGDIQISQNMCPSGIWIGSQLQIIKQRNLTDVYTDEAVWKKIYPQEDGVPQITQSGKYWVKLYYMGKPIKIEVDQRVPTFEDSKILFPESDKKNEKWTLILTKALIKYFKKASLQQNITGSGLMIYALTGMITQNVPLSAFKDWKKVAELMGDQHYQKKDIVLSCFSNYDRSMKSSSNHLRNRQQAEHFLNFQNSTVKDKKWDPQIVQDLKNYEQGKEYYVNNDVIGGYAYCVGDYFNNQDFNMVFSQQKSTKQTQLRNEYNELSKVSFGNKTRQEKLQHRRKKKEIKESLAIEEKKRVQQINKPKKDYHFMKILSDVKVYCDYSDKEILLAKKCVLNNLPQPPNYDIPIEKEQSSQSISLIKLKEEGDQVKPLDDFSGIANAKDIFKREDEGVWIKDQDIFSTFENIQIYYNPNIFEHKSIEKVEHKGAEMFTSDEDKQILVIQKAGNPHEQEEKQENEEKEEKVIEEVKKQMKIDLLFGFAVQQSKWDTLNKPYSMLQKFDFQSYRTTSNAVTLDKSIASTFLQLKNQNSVFKLYTMSKGRYCYWLGSNVPYKLVSIGQYLTDYEGYTAKNLPIQYPALEGSTYNQLARIKISHEGEENNTILLKLNNCPKYVEQYLSYRLVKIPENGKYTFEENEGIVTKPYESLHLAYEYSRIALQPKANYYLIIQAYPHENLADGALDFTMLSKISDANIQLIQQVQPLKLVEKYIPNKYGTIIKQRIFANNPSNVGLLFKVVEGEEGQPIQGGGKAAKKGGKEEPAFEIIEKPLKDKRLIHLKIMKGGELAYYEKGFNEIIIPNIEFESTKSEEVQYSIEASFDLREWPQASAQNQENNKICWSLQVSGQDSIAVVRDTIQEQKQKQTRKSWEDKQPGRAEKAKKARQRFLLEMKKQNGQELTEEELQIVNAPRLTKKQLQEQNAKNEDKKGGKGGKKDDKKAGKDSKKQQVSEQKAQERVLPKSEDNFMIEVKQFLKTLEDCKVTYVKLEQGDEQRIRTEQEQKAIKQGALMSKQNRIGQLARNIQAREAMKIREKDKKDKLTILLDDLKEHFKSEWTKYLTWRKEDQEKDQVKMEKEKALIDVLKQEKPTISEADLTKIINEYRDISGHNSKLADVGDMLRKNIKIGGIVQKITNHLAGWQVEELKAILEEIKNEKVEGIDENMMKEVNEMLEQAQKNPAMVSEKQAQLKKAKKGGKK